jgi:hypothetical protein
MQDTAAEHSTGVRARPKIGSAVSVTAMFQTKPGPPAARVSATHGRSGGGVDPGRASAAPHLEAEEAAGGRSGRRQGEAGSNPPAQPAIAVLQSGTRRSPHHPGGRLPADLDDLAQVIAHGAAGAEIVLVGQSLVEPGMSSGPARRTSISLRSAAMAGERCSSHRKKDHGSQTQKYFLPRLPFVQSHRPLTISP